MIYNTYLILVIVLLACATNSVNSIATPAKPKLDGSTSTAGGSTSKDQNPEGSGSKDKLSPQKTAAADKSLAENFPVAEYTYQFLSNPDGYSEKVMAASSSKPYLCLRKFMSPLKFAHTPIAVVIGITGCRVDTTRRNGICYSDECSETEIKDYYVTYNTKSSSITDISVSNGVATVASTSVYNMDSTKFFDSSAVNEILSQKGKYICRVGESLTPYYINADAASYSYLLPKGCLVAKATANGDCTCPSAMPYRVTINKDGRIKEVKSLALTATDSTDTRPKLLFDLFRATLGTSNSYGYLPAKAWANSWYICFANYDPKVQNAGAEQNAINAQYVFEGCRYNSKPAPNGACPASCTTFERMTVKIVYDETKQTATSVTPGKIVKFFLGEHDMTADNAAIAASKPLS